MKLFFDNNFNLERSEGLTIVQGSTDFDDLDVYVASTALVNYSAYSFIYSFKRSDGRIVSNLATLQTSDLTETGYIGFTGKLDDRALRCKGTLELTITFLLTKNNIIQKKTSGTIIANVLQAVYSDNDIYIVSQGDEGTVITSMQNSINAISNSASTLATNKLDKVTGATTYDQVYYKTAAGVQSMYNATYLALASTIVTRDSGGYSNFTGIRTGNIVSSATLNMVDGSNDCSIFFDNNGNIEVWTDSGDNNVMTFSSTGTNVNGFELTGLKPPANNTDAVPKAYSDNNLATAKSYSDSNLASAKMYTDTNIGTVELEAGYSLTLSLNPSNFVLTASLKNKNGTVISSEYVDLPNESAIVNAQYDDANKQIIFTLQNGTTFNVSVADIIAGLISSDDINNVVVLTQAEYDALGSYSDTTLYITTTTDSGTATALDIINTRLSTLEALANISGNVDQTPTQNSTNVVTSGGVYTAIQNRIYLHVAIYNYNNLFQIMITALSSSGEEFTPSNLFYVAGNKTITRAVVVDNGSNIEINLLNHEIYATYNNTGYTLAVEDLTEDSYVINAL